MPLFEIESGGKRYQIEAPDQQSALQALSGLSGGAGSPPSPPEREYSGGDAFRSGVVQGATLGFGDEILGTLMTPIEMGIDAVQGKPFDPGRSWQQAVDRNRETDAQMEAANEGAALAGNIAGGLGTGIGLASKGVTLMNAAKPTIASMLPRAAAEGAIYGGLTGLGTGETLGEKLQEAAFGGLVGAGAGGALGAAGGMLANKAARAAVPTVDDLRTQASALYDAAHNSGVTIPGNVTKRVADDISAEVLTQGIDPDLHPRAAAVLRRLNSIPENGLTAQEAHTMRRVLASAGTDRGNPDEQRIASIMVRKFDDLMSQYVPELQEANGLYRRASKGQVIEDTIQKARDQAGVNYTASGFEQALRRNFQNLLQNKRALRGFTSEEVAAIRKVANGGSVGNVMRFMGKWSAGGPVQAVASSMGPAGLVTMATGNPVLGAAAGLGTVGVGGLARAAATRSTLNNARLAAAMPLTGGASPFNAPAGAGTTGVLQALSALGGQQLPDYVPNPGVLSRMMALN